MCFGEGETQLQERLRCQTNTDCIPGRGFNVYVVNEAGAA
jgi:hypothetical protein